MEHRKKALELFRELYAETPMFAFQLRIKELS
jgi:hypothetical protein